MLYIVILELLVDGGHKKKPQQPLTGKKKDKTETNKSQITDHTWSCRLRSICVGDMTGSSYGGSCQ